MRIDAHQHFWVYDSAEYPWIDDGMSVLRRDFLPADLAPLLARHEIGGSIAVQARQTLDETRWLLELARRNDVVRGVVGWVDLRAGDVAATLDGLTRDPLLVGVRHALQDEPDDDYVLRPEFRRGLGELARRGLTYDILIFPRHLRAATRVVAEHGDQAFVLDHVAKPEVAAGRTEPWATDLRALADHDNVYCKLSGLVTEADWSSWQAEDLAPYLATALDAFGEDRVMFGSDWPVCTVAGAYERVLAAVASWSVQLTPSARDKLFGGNAARFYGLV